MTVAFTPINGFDELRQVLDGLRSRIKSASSSPRLFGAPKPMLANTDTYLDFRLGEMHAFIGIQTAGGGATIRYSEVNEHNAPPNVRALFNEFLKDVCRQKEKASFIDANQVTEATVQRTDYAPELLKGTPGERVDFAKEFAEGVSKYKVEP